jgi:flagellar assembly factor FliW
MIVATTRFGEIRAEDGDVIRFDRGPFGYEDVLEWLAIPDPTNEHVGWLQAIAEPELAFAVVSPEQFASDYEFRAPAHELAPLGITRPSDAHVLAIVSCCDGNVTANLKAPLVINLERRLAKQIIAGGDLSLQHPLTPPAIDLRRAA